MNNLFKEKGFIIFDTDEKTVYNPTDECFNYDFVVDCVFETENACINIINDNFCGSFDELDNLSVKEILYEVTEVSSKKVVKNGISLQEE